MSVSGKNIDVSVVIPVYNERDNVPLLYSSLKDVLKGAGLVHEIIFIDDGSRDGTRESLRELARTDKAVKVILFRTNFGQSAAMAAGFKNSRGEIVVAMDGDLQNDPRDIPRLLQKIEEGHDVVAGWRKNRKDKLLIRKIPSRLANRLICSITDVRLHDTGCSLKAFRKEIIENIRLYGELHRFIPVLARIEGARITEMPVDHHARKFGKSKYNITRTFRVIMDLISLNLLLKHLRNPLRFFGSIGNWMIAAGLGAGIWVMCRIFFTHTSIDQLNVMITLVFLMIAVGVQFLFMGLMATLVTQTGERRGRTVLQLTAPNSEDDNE